MARIAMSTGVCKTTWWNWPTAVRAMRMPLPLAIGRSLLYWSQFGHPSGYDLERPGCIKPITRGVNSFGFTAETGKSLETRCMVHGS